MFLIERLLLFLVSKKNMTKIGVWADVLSRLTPSPVDSHKNISIETSLRAVFQLTKEDLAAQLDRDEKTGNIPHSSQIHFPQPIHL